MIRRLIPARDLRDGDHPGWRVIGRVMVTGRVYFIAVRVTS